MKSDYCEYCDARLNSRMKSVTVYRHHKGRHFIFERVPARVCTRCGERYFPAGVVHTMDRLMKRAGPIASFEQVPVISLKSVR